MATSSRKAAQQPATRRGRPHSWGRPSWLRLLVLALAWSALLGACAPVRPVVKVGVLAPFEGLYRRSGYEALAAARAAIEAAAPSLAAQGIEVVPLALDTSLDPQRAAEKLLADPALAAVVGPLFPTDAPAMAAALDAAGVPWFAPYAVGPQGFLAPQEGAWAVKLARAVATAARAQGATRLLLAGWDAAGWPPPRDEMWQAVNELPLVFVDSEMNAGDIQAGDALFWAGDPAQGAELLGAVRGAELDLPFWLGPGSADATFLEHAPANIRTAPAVWGDVLWLTWHETAYNGASIPLPVNGEPLLSWHGASAGAAAHAALAQIAGEGASAAAGGPHFRPAVYRLGPDGSLAAVP